MSKYGKFIDVRIVGDGYEVVKDHIYYSKRYNRSITLRAGFYSDGATRAPDLKDTDAWLIHDEICRHGVWDDGTKISNWEASTVLSDLLWRDGYTFRSKTWWLGTWLFGGGAARKNGMFRAK